MCIRDRIHTAPSDFRVKELVGYGRMPHQKLMAGKSKEDEEVIRWAMEVTGTWKFRDKSIYEISGGETQRVWIATVLAQKPEIMFLDEPTTYLDISHQLETMNLVKKLNRETGIGVVMVLHDLAQAMEVSDHVIVIRDGEKYDEGAPQNVITSKMMKDVYQAVSYTHLVRLHTQTSSVAHWPESLNPYPFVPSEAERAGRCKEIMRLQATGLAERLTKIGIRKCVIGVSGGLDSTLALLVIKEAYDMLG